MKHQPKGQTTTLGTTSPTLCDQCVGSITSHKVRMNKGRGMHKSPVLHQLSQPVFQHDYKFHTTTTSSFNYK